MRASIDSRFSLKAILHPLWLACLVLAIAGTGCATRRCLNRPDDTQACREAFHSLRDAPLEEVDKLVTPLKYSDADRCLTRTRGDLPKDEELRQEVQRAAACVDAATAYLHLDLPRPGRLEVAPKGWRTERLVEDWVIDRGREMLGAGCISSSYHATERIQVEPSIVACALLLEAERLALIRDVGFPEDAYVCNQREALPEGRRGHLSDLADKICSAVKSSGNSKGVTTAVFPDSLSNPERVRAVLEARANATRKALLATEKLEAMPDPITALEELARTKCELPPIDKTETVYRDFLGRLQGRLAADARRMRVWNAGLAVRTACPDTLVGRTFAEWLQKEHKLQTERFNRAAGTTIARGVHAALLTHMRRTLDGEKIYRALDDDIWKARQELWRRRRLLAYESGNWSATGPCAPLSQTAAPSGFNKTFDVQLVKATCGTREYERTEEETYTKDVPVEVTRHVTVENRIEPFNHHNCSANLNGRCAEAQVWKETKKVKETRNEERKFKRPVQVTVIEASLAGEMRVRLDGEEFVVPVQVTAETTARDGRRPDLSAAWDELRGVAVSRADAAVKPRAGAKYIESIRRRMAEMTSPELREELALTCIFFGQPCSSEPDRAFGWDLGEMRSLDLAPPK